MEMKKERNFSKNKLATTVGEIFYTKEKMVAQFDIKKLEKRGDIGGQSLPTKIRGVHILRFI